MLEEFLYKHDIDLALLQEVTNTNITMFRRHTAHINIGHRGSGDAILAKDCYYSQTSTASLRDEESLCFSMR
jgi:hypothetical protein